MSISTCFLRGPNGPKFCVQGTKFNLEDWGFAEAEHKLLCREFKIYQPEGDKISKFCHLRRRILAMHEIMISPDHVFSLEFARPEAIFALSDWKPFNFYHRLYYDAGRSTKSLASAGFKISVLSPLVWHCGKSSFSSQDTTPPHWWPTVEEARRIWPRDKNFPWSTDFLEQSLQFLFKILPEQG